MPSLLLLKPTQQLFQGISYEQVKPGKPPLPIVSAPRPSSAQANLHPLLRLQRHPQKSTGSSFDDNQSNKKRDSGYANYIHRDSNGKSTQSLRSSQSLRKSQSLPRFTSPILQQPSSLKRLQKLSENRSSMEASTSNGAPRLPELLLPDEASTSLSLKDLATPGNMEFSNRGSLYIGGKRASELDLKTDPFPRRVVSSVSTRGQTRLLSIDEQVLSQKVMSMYENGTDDPAHTTVKRLSTIPAEPEKEVGQPVYSPSFLSPDDASNRGSIIFSKRNSLIRDDQELAGGIEDWQDVRNEDVDRYGFIQPRRLADASSDSLLVPQPVMHRVATSLQLAADTPRMSRVSLRRTPSASRSMRSLGTAKDVGGSSGRPVSSQSVNSIARNISVIRNATNKLPYNKTRRYVDEAGDMLTLPHGVVTIDHTLSPTESRSAKKKERSREEKWRKMAKVKRSDGRIGSTDYEFDPKDPKIISRTWKGIPDRWRATAWHSFLSASAKMIPDSQTDVELIASFNELVDQASPDDVQIDLDVPRTISSHIMFRRRYRGGQRLLFRVLHSLSLFFPETGYVQGMAALAATFLSYFEEEMAFVMLVRLWQTRGLDRLYRNELSGLMNALDEFESQWLAGGVINAKLVCFLPFPSSTKLQTNNFGRMNWI